MNDQDKSQRDEDIKRIIQSTRAEKDALLLEVFELFLAQCEKMKIDPYLTLQELTEHIKERIGGR